MKFRPCWSSLPVMLLLGACGEQPPPPPPPVDVSVILVAPNNRPLDLTYTARTRGVREVEVHARVPGILEKRLYDEGDTVKAGAVLFRIDPAPAAAEVRSAQGLLGTQAARLREAGQRRERITALFARGFSSAQIRDQAEADYAAARSGADAARAELDQARLRLSWTQVRAPISGVTGLESRSEGNLVDITNPQSTLLTTITQTDTLFVDFAMPELEAQSVRTAMGKGAIMVELITPGSDTIVARASVKFVDTLVDMNTGTVNVRATLDNAGGRLAPGQFISARLTGLAAPSGIFLPSRAVGHGSDGPYVWKIDAKNLAQMQPVSLGTTLGNLVQIKKGVAAGDRIVVEGVLKLQPEAMVKPTRVKPEQAVIR